jgi:hypothetical protein
VIRSTSYEKRERYVDFKGVPDLRALGRVASDRDGRCGGMRRGRVGAAGVHHSTSGRRHVFRDRRNFRRRVDRRRHHVTPHALSQARDCRPMAAGPFADHPLASVLAGQSSSATSVSCDGAVIGGQSGSSADPQGVIWINGQVVPAGFLAPAGAQRSSLVNAVSCDGTLIAGQATNDAGDLEGFYATLVGGQPGPLTGIGYLSTNGQDDSSVNALTADGRMVGRASWHNAGVWGFAQFIFSPADGSDDAAGCDPGLRRGRLGQRGHARWRRGGRCGLGPRWLWRLDPRAVARGERRG